MIKQTSLWTLMAGAAGAALVLSAAPAMAQHAAVTPDTTAPAATAGPAAATTANPQQLGEIVVTANRVASTAQKTPIALTVYSSQALQNAGIRSVQALQTIDPSVNVTSNSGAAYVAIRGIASTDTTEIGDPSVPIARDGFFTNRSFSIGSSLYDIQRIEVLKGPQGTLFGRNSTGGLISIITNKPGKDYGGYGVFDVGNYRTINAEAGVNVPLGDKVQIRLSGITQNHEGYRHLTVVNDRGDDNNTKSGRAQIAFQPFDGFSGLIQYQHDDINDVGDVTKNLPIAVVTPIGDSKTFPNYQPTRTRITGDRVRWEFSYDRLPLGMTLTYAGGYDVEDWKHKLDASGPSHDPLSQFVQHEHPKTWNHEVRIATRQDTPFTLQAGYFHFSEKNTVDSGLAINSGPAAGSRLVQFNYDVHTQSDAVFGQAGYKIADAVRLTGGIRYTWDKKQRTGESQLRCDLAGIPPFLYGVIGCAGVPPILTTPSNGNIKQSKPTFHAGLDWTPTTTNLVYAKFDTGYKSGGFNSNGSAPSVDYGPETLRAWEVGTKNRFLNNKLQINLDGFYQIYKGYQASQNSAVVSSGNGVFNVGSAKIYGAEAQVVVLVPNVARIDANATYLHARFDNNVGLVARGDTAATPAFIGGNRLPNAPSFVMSGGIEHDFVLGDSTITLRVDGKYSSAFYYSVFNDADTKSPRYATGNATITYKPASGHWQVQAYVRNFTDHTVLALAARNYVSGFNTYEFQPPRTFGGRFSFNF
jgi:iron complex outermembrane receptor protein